MSKQPIVRSDGHSTITIIPSKNQTPESVDEDFVKGFDTLNEMLAQGTAFWNLNARRFGRLQLARTKEVGPPPWRLPKAYIRPSRTFIQFGIGWRSTCYSFYIGWRK